MMDYFDILNLSWDIYHFDWVQLVGTAYGNLAPAGSTLCIRCQRLSEILAIEIKNRFFISVSTEKKKKNIPSVEPQQKNRRKKKYPNELY